MNTKFDDAALIAADNVINRVLKLCGLSISISNG